MITTAGGSPTPLRFRGESFVRGLRHGVANEHAGQKPGGNAGAPEGDAGAEALTPQRNADAVSNRVASERHERSRTRIEKDRTALVEAAD